MNIVYESKKSDQLVNIWRGVCVIGPTALISAHKLKAMAKHGFCKILDHYYCLYQSVSAWLFVCVETKVYEIKFSLFVYFVIVRHILLPYFAFFMPPEKYFYLFFWPRPVRLLVRKRVNNKITHQNHYVA